MKNIWVLIVFLTALAGCSTIIEGRSEEITINTDPEGASCVLTRAGLTLGKVSPTPGTINIEKSKDDITIKCKEDGYKTAAYTNKSDAAAATFGNIAAGGLIGWGIDSATGSDNKYEDHVNMTLAKK